MADCLALSPYITSLHTQSFSMHITQHQWIIEYKCACGFTWSVQVDIVQLHSSYLNESLLDNSHLCGSLLFSDDK